jgi:hypothetical protein
MTGFCLCGCGEKTRTAPQTHRGKGWVKGEPLRYAYGHSKRSLLPEYREEDRGYQTPCWIWQRAINDAGYGALWTPERRKTRAHIYFYEKKFGKVPDGLQLDHLCRVRECCNPDHVEPVTPCVNVRRSLVTKLTPDQVLAIRSLGGTMPNRELGQLFGITGQHVGVVRRGIAWKDI